MQARFIKYVWENQAHTTASFYFAPDKPYYFTAGQYTSVTVPHANPDGRGLTRTMTITSSPNDKQLKYTMKIPSRCSSYKQALLDMKHGDPVGMTDAMGDMVLPLDSSLPLVFVAGGLGIASYVSMVQWLTEQKDSRDITLLYAIRSTDDILMQDIFDGYASVGKLTKIIYTTDHKIDDYPWNGTIRKARLTSADIMSSLKTSGTQIYLSGSESMVEQLVHELEGTHQIPQYRLAYDYFDGYTEL